MLEDVGFQAASLVRCGDERDASSLARLFNRNASFSITCLVPAKKIQQIELGLVLALARTQLLGVRAEQKAAGS